MSLFGNFCLGDETVKSSPTTISPMPSANDEKLPFHFDTSRRASVSAECPLPNDPQSDAFTPASGDLSIGHKCATQLRNSLRRIIFFADLGDNALNIILKSLICKSQPAGTTVIQQGDEGDYFYIIQQGHVQYYVNGKFEGEGGPGSAFGELALLYNSPRAASVETVTDCTFWLLDRATFKHIMKSKGGDKREHSRSVLAQVEIFSTLSLQSQLKIADALQPVSYEAGQEIFHEGDAGEYFYLIDEGSVDISANGKHLITQGAGSYFGELALINDNPRAATVKATTPLKLERLNKSGFERLIGPDVVAELRKRDPTTKPPSVTDIIA